MLAHWSIPYLLTKFVNNRNLAIFISITFIALLWMSYSLIRKHFASYRAVMASLLVVLLLGFLQFIQPLPLFFAPDLLITLVALWALVMLRQSISPAIFIVAALLIYFVLFSTPRLDIEFDNRYYISIKPFLYLIILYFASAAKMTLSLRPIVYGSIIFYPLTLLWNVGLWWNRDGFFMSRPNFLFENNFEVPWILSCFVVAAFIYKDKDLRLYLLVAISVILAGSRSGLASFLLISAFYLLSLSRVKIAIASIPITSALTYLVFIRGSSSVNALQWEKIDRVQTLLGILAFYDFRFSEILSYPLGVGIYQKIPLNLCNRMEGYADWFTGSYFNCDPIMLQSFVSRSLFQFGIYVLALIPILFFWEAKKRMGWYLALLSIIPMLGASFSVGGFSNGIAFGGFLLCFLAYRQEQTDAIKDSTSMTGLHNVTATRNWV
jgi:hypothetical protein